MNQYKSIFTSVTFWGTAIAAFSTLFPVVYAKLGITDQTVLASHIVAGIGYCIAVYGRFRATTRVNLTGKAPTQ